MTTRAISLAELFAEHGVEAQGVQSVDADAAVLVVFRIPVNSSRDLGEHLYQCWRDLTRGTPLEHVRAMVLTDDVEMSFVRLESEA